jgi:carbamoyl-phosphate synthase small subunit
MRAHLMLEDGSVFAGESLGATGRATGELVFTTSMTGYQEILTDPSYAGQIVLMTYPLIGNYGVNDESDESRRAQAAGFVVREACKTPSNWRARAALHDYLAARGITAISGVDTRAVTLRVRYYGVMMATITTDETPDEAFHRLQTVPRYDEEDFVYRVTTPEPYKWGYDGMEPIDAPDDHYRKRVVILDCGVKWNIPRRLASLGVRSIILPATATAEQVLVYQPDGVLLSPDPGDPARLQPVIETVRQLLGKVPVAGICLGNQLVSLALGARTYKLKFGHRGGNHPVKNLLTGRVDITAQNHGYKVADLHRQQHIGVLCLQAKILLQHRRLGSELPLHRVGLYPLGKRDAVGVRVRQQVFAQRVAQRLQLPCGGVRPQLEGVAGGLQGEGTAHFDGRLQGRVCEGGAGAGQPRAGVFQPVLGGDADLQA